MKRLTYLLVFVLLAGMSYAQKAKYVFFFIGDGMGVNQVNATEMYLADKEEGRIGTRQLLFGSFPAAGIATSFSASNSITDSAAGGTALATGSKTYNGAIGVDIDKQALQSVAYRAQASGKRVGIATSVSVDHATPAAFYAHQPKRGNYYEIACELPQSGFDFFAGAGFLKPSTTADKREATPVYELIEQGGYTIARGLDEYEEKSDNADKLVLIQEKGQAADCLPYALDRKENDLTLKQITESAIDFLMKDNKAGFFLMVEGGKIDWACHSNDPATAFTEIIDLDQAIGVAYEFYKKHPKETLIVVSADHETGGLGLGTGTYTLNLKALANQRQSLDALSRMITDLRRQDTSWEQVKALLADKMGFWTELPLTWEQEKALRDAYESSFVKHKVKFKETLYSKTEPLAVAANEVMSEIAHLGWTSGSHTAEYVPVYAVGAGAELFMGKMDNTEIPKRIAKAGRYK